MDEKQSYSLASSLMSAISSEEVNGIVKGAENRYWFDQPENWKNYGGREKNWDTAGNQQSSGVGALVENVVNGMDAVLLRKAEEAGIKDNRAPNAPQSMQEAVCRFFKVPEGKLSNLTDSEKRKLAGNSVKVGVERARKGSLYPTYTIVDEGIGQRPADFPKTFVSLSEKNKEGIKFVQGKFNQGSTGVLRYCTKGDMQLGFYKLIISKRYDHEYWGWTLVRVREPRAQEAMPVVEYFAPVSGGVARFTSEEIRPFEKLSKFTIKSGSIVKIYEVDISRPFHNVDLGIYEALATSLIQPPLPIHTFDFGAEPVEGKGELRALGIAERISTGLLDILGHFSQTKEATINTDLTDDETPETINPFVTHIASIQEPELGSFDITAHCRQKLPNFLSKQPKRVFFTINGQAHASERASWLNQSCNLGPIMDHTIINVDCTNLTNSAIAQIFMTDRERMVDNRIARELKDLVRDALKESSELKQFADKINLLRARKHLEDKSQVKDLVQGMVKADPSFKELFGHGNELEVITERPGGEQTFEGKQFPTFLHPLNTKTVNNKLTFSVPQDGTRKLRCATDASNDYFSRGMSPGSKVMQFTSKSQCRCSVSLKDGIATFTFASGDSLKVGDVLEGVFGFDDVARPEPLVFELQIEIGPPEPRQPPNSPSPKPGVKTTNSDDLKIPNITWIGRDEYDLYDFTDESTLTILQSSDGLEILVNRDHRVLQVMRKKEKSEANILYKENIFRYGIAIISLSIYKKLVTMDDERATENARTSADAMSAYFVPLVSFLSNLKL